MRVGAGFLGLPHSLGGSNRFEKFLEPVFAKEASVLEEGGKAAQVAAGEKQVEHTDPLEYALMFASVGAAVLGWWLAQRAYKKADKGYKEPIRRCSARSTRRCSASTTSTSSTTGSSPAAKDWPAFVWERWDWAKRLWKFDANVIDGTVNGAGWSRGCRHRFDVVGQVDYRRPVRERCGHRDADVCRIRCAYSVGIGAVVRAGMVGGLVGLLFSIERA